MVADKQYITSYFDQHAEHRDRWKRRNWYYHETLERLFRFVIPAGASVLEVGCGTGDLLAITRPARGVGVDISPRMIEIARSKYPQYEWRVEDAEYLKGGERFDYIIVSDVIGFLDDIERAFHALQKVSHGRTRVIVTHYNYFWEPVFRIAELLGLKARLPLQNWISAHDVENMLQLAGFETIKQGRKMILPFYIPGISPLCNRVVGNLPFVGRIGIVQYLTARRVPEEKKEYSVSIIIPARNEKGNIERAVREAPDIGIRNEIIFVEGHSQDSTLEEIKRVAEAYAGQRNIRWAVQGGTGKGDAVRKGFAMAEGDILMILDADLTVRPRDLTKFYNAIASGRGEFINGSRLVYQLEKDSMRFLNILGNKFFSIVFTWLVGQRVKDTLCGTKALFRNDYNQIAAGRNYFGEFDPFGDFDLLFGASKLGLKIVEVPVRYHARTYGKTNIQRWRHGWLLLKMAAFASRKLKFI
jgi:SAM-dependent methyltransferase